jgi:hypothetical protein
MAADEYRKELYVRLREGSPFAELEDWIEMLPLSDDSKAGLWLLAWAEQDRSSQRRIADEALSAVES